MTATLTHAAFTPQLHTTFRLVAPGAAPLPLELIEVTKQRESDRFTSFSVVLRGPAGLYIPQGTYHFEHDAMGAFDMFIVPIRQDQSGLDYEATFSYLQSEVSA